MFSVLTSATSRALTSQFVRLCVNRRNITVTASMASNTQKEVKHRIGFLGSGQMAQALAKGFLCSGKINGAQVTMTDIFGTSGSDAQYFEPIRRIQEEYGVEYLQDNEMMARKSDVVFACVKPNVILPAVEQIGECLADKLLVSVAAGITMEQISGVIPKTTRLIRVMPNTPCLVQSGTAVFATGPNVRPEDLDVVSALCSGPFTVFEQIPESMINAASGISGCGPAYLFLVAEALADGGVRMGVPRALAHKLAVGTILGAAEMMKKTGENPSKLKNDVCSPGGATIAAIHELEQGGVRAAFINAVRAAALRSKELAD